MKIIKKIPKSKIFFDSCKNIKSKRIIYIWNKLEYSDSVGKIGFEKLNKFNSHDFNNLLINTINQNDKDYFGELIKNEEQISEEAILLLIKESKNTMIETLLEKKLLSKDELNKMQSFFFFFFFFKRFFFFFFNF